MAINFLKKQPMVLNPASINESVGVRWLFIGISLLFIGLFLILPLVAVFGQALAKGLGAYFGAISQPDTLAAIRLTLVTAAIAVPLNLIFGVSAAWAISKFEFPGKNFLLTLIDLPFAISPVVSGLMFVLLFGRQGWLWPWLSEHNIKIAFEFIFISLKENLHN